MNNSLLPECVFSSSGFGRRICCSLWSLWIEKKVKKKLQLKWELHCCQLHSFIHVQWSICIFRTNYARLKWICLIYFSTVPMGNYAHCVSINFMNCDETEGQRSVRKLKSLVWNDTHESSLSDTLFRFLYSFCQTSWHGERTVMSVETDRESV